MLISYAQNFEDIILWRALKHVPQGVYMDIGAQDPVLDSVSLAFYKQGWRGVHVEPNPHYAKLLREKRPDEVVIEAVVAEGDAGPVKFYVIENTGLSTCDLNIAEQHRSAGFPAKTISVDCTPLATLLDLYATRDIHWLKIDVEGFEAQVLRSWGSSSVRPWILVLESVLPLSQVPSHEAWEMEILNRGYEFVYFDGLNRYYLSKLHPELRDAFNGGPNIYDGFALNYSQVRNIQHELDLVYSSLSWRITKPLRNIKNFFKRFFKKNSKEG
jgi:FkbM family methyltransferase